MNIRYLKPSEIEKESFNIIQTELDGMGRKIPKEILPTILRVIHTTADFDYADTMCFSEGVIDRAKKAIREGAHIVTDTNMALSGINKKILGK